MKKKIILNFALAIGFCACAVLGYYLLNNASANVDAIINNPASYADISETMLTKSAAENINASERAADGFFILIIAGCGASIYFFIYAVVLLVKTAVQRK